MAAKPAMQAAQATHEVAERRPRQVERIAITLLIAAIGGYIGYRLKIPAGTLIGAMVAVAASNLAFGFTGEIPRDFRMVAQIIVGGMLGLSVTRETVAGLRSMIGPAILLVFFMIGMSLLAGFILAKVTGWDLATAFFGSSPGGMTEMTLASMSYGADTPTVALLQLIRMISVVTILPIVLKWVLKN